MATWGIELEQELLKIRLLLMAIFIAVIAGFTGILERATSALTSYVTINTPEEILRSAVSVAIILIATAFWGLFFAAMFQRIRAASESQQRGHGRLRAATLDLSRIALAFGTAAMWALSIALANAAASFVLSSLFE